MVEPNQLSGFSIVADMPVGNSLRRSLAMHDDQIF